jgi:glycerol-3-phosphate dehydrogenase
MRLIVVGAGAMGTSLAGLYSRHNQVDLWVRRENPFHELQRYRINEAYLPDYPIPAEVHLIHGAINWEDYDVAVMCVPTQFIRSVCEDIGLSVFDGCVINTAKGLEIGTFKTPCEILEDLGLERKKVYTLSGPSHAEEMCRGVPTSLVLGGDLQEKEDLPVKMLEAISAKTLRPYFSRDRLGVELGGALKNIIAIACGVSEGLGYGMNTTSTIITRGLSEIKKYGVHRGAQSETFSGLSCLGDLVTTCCSPHSRNRNFGRTLVEHPQDPSKWGKLVEGASTVKSLWGETHQLGFELPLAHSIYEVVWNRVEPREVIQSLLNRPYKEED